MAKVIFSFCKNMVKLLYKFLMVCYTSKDMKTQIKENDINTLTTGSKDAGVFAFDVYLITNILIEKK